MPIKRISEELVSEIVINYPELRALNLSNNEIVEIQNLSPLSGLTSINISENRILVNNLHFYVRYMPFKSNPFTGIKSSQRPQISCRDICIQQQNLENKLDGAGFPRIFGPRGQST